MSVSIIIVNYNTKELIHSCLASIIDNTTGINYEIIVVDNNSSDGSQEAIIKMFPSVRLIQSELNLGFGKANNLGASYAKYEILFFLNSDTVLIEDSIRKMNEFFLHNEAKLNIGVLGTLLVDTELAVNGYGSEFPSLVKTLKKNISKLPLLKILSQSETLTSIAIDKDHFIIDYVIGADMFMRKSLFEEIGGFDKDYFMYYEESDLQFKVASLGYYQYIFTGTKIIHLEEGSSETPKVPSNNKRITLHRSRNIYFMKNDYLNFQRYKLLDKLFLVLTIFNLKYSLNDNVSYIKEILKTY